MRPDFDVWRKVSIELISSSNKLKFLYTRPKQGLAGDGRAKIQIKRVFTSHFAPPVLSLDINQTGTMKNHKQQPGIRKNRPGTMNNHKKQPGTLNTYKTHLES